MSHEYECCSVFCSSFHAVISCDLAGFICDSLCNCFLVIVDNSRIIAYFTKHWLCDCYRFEFIFVTVERFYHLIVLSTMCRLNNKILNSVYNCAVKSLIHIVDYFIVSCFYMVDDNLCCKCTSYRPVRICFLKFVFDSFDILCTAVIERSTKTYNEKLILTNFILITRIILGCIACICTEIFRTCFFAFNQCFLSICQFVPCFFCSFAVFVGCVISFLNVDLVDQCCNFIRCFLVIIRCFCCICSICVFFCICCFLCCCLCSVIRSINACRSHHCDCCYSHCQCQCFYSFVFHVCFLLYLWFS